MIKVPASGILASAGLVVVGSQPGKVDAREQLPFSGPAGRELNKILLNVEIVRDECYLTNVISYYGRPVASYVKYNSRTGKVTATEEGQKCIQELKDELTGCSADVIIAAGNVALYALTSRWGINNWRGSVLKSTLLPGKLVIPILHPETIAPPKCVFLNKWLITWDLQRAREVQLKGFHPLPRRLSTGPSFAECMNFLTTCKTKERVVYDIEVHNQEVSCISFATDACTAISIPFVDNSGDYFSVSEELRLWQEIARLLEDESVEKVGQNIAFDAHFLLRKYEIRCRNMDDTMIAQKILMPDFKKGLDMITSLWTEHPYYKADGKEWFKAGGRWENLWKYNATDSIICAEAFPKMVLSLEKQENTLTYQRQKKLIPPLVYMMERGIKANISGIKAEAAASELQIDKLIDEFCGIAGRYINPNSDKQLMEYFYAEKGIKPYKKRNAKGKWVPTIDGDALKKLKITHGIPEAQLIRDVKSLGKLCANYLNEAKFDADGRVRCSFDPVGTKFSRLSSSSNIFGTGMNLQNWPHSVFKYLEADSGYAGYEIDLSQAENRMVAYIGDIPEMIKAFEDGKDVHSLTSNLMFGLPYEQVREEDAADVLCKLGDGTHPYRYFGKKCNHELNYDMGEISFADQIEVKRATGKYLHGLYHITYPGVRKGFHRYVQNCLRTNRTLVNLMDRRTKFMGAWGDKMLKEAYACIPQGTTGDLINECGLEYIYYNLAPVELLCQIHDAVLFQIPLSLGWEEHARLLRLVKLSLERPLKIHHHEFIIPADITLFKRFKRGKEFKAASVPGDDVSFGKLLEKEWEFLK